MTASPGRRPAAEVLGFGVVGIVNTACSFAAYQLFVLVLPYGIALALAYLLGIAIGFIGNSRYVFLSAFTRAKAARYGLLHACLLGVQYGLLALWIEVVGLGANLAGAVNLPIVTLISFFATRRILRD